MDKRSQTFSPIILFICLIVLLAGAYKAGFLNTPDVEQAVLEGVTKEQNRSGGAGGSEVVYFDPRDKVWKSGSGICHACTQEHGFFANGQLEGGEPANWIFKSFRLENDLGEPPPVEEVRGVFQQFYSLESRQFGVYVEQQGNIYSVILAIGEFQEDLDFTDPQGDLAAYYFVEVVE